MRPHSTTGTPRRPGIYAWANRVNGKVYVGSAVSLYLRKSDHLATLRRGTSQCSRLQRAWSKYGEEAFEWRILELVADAATLIEREQYWIDSLGGHSRGYNTSPTAGNTFGVHCSEEKRAKIAASLKGKSQGPHTPEHRAKISAAQKGRYFSPEHRAKIAATLKGRPWPALAQERALAANTGRVMSEEARQKLSASLRAVFARPEEREKIAERAQRFRGRKWSPETIARMAAAARARPPRSPESIAKTAAKNRGRRLNTKLTEEQVRQIRARYRPGKGVFATLAAEYGMCEEAIRNVIKRKTWADIADSTDDD